MKSLFLTREQAAQLGSDLTEYVGMQDSNLREVFEGFEVRFREPLSLSLCPESGFEVHPIAEYLEISPETKGEQP